MAALCVFQHIDFAGWGMNRFCIKKKNKWKHLQQGTLLQLASELGYAYTNLKTKVSPTLSMSLDLGVQETWVTLEIDIQNFWLV